MGHDQPTGVVNLGPPKCSGFPHTSQPPPIVIDLDFDAARPQTGGPAGAQVIDRHASTIQAAVGATAARLLGRDEHALQLGVVLKRMHSQLLADA